MTLSKAAHRDSPLNTSILSPKKQHWSQRLVDAKPRYFWWCAVNLLCACLAIISWIYIPQVFENPHKPSHYKLLKKINRLPKIQAFNSMDPPVGETISVKNLYSNFIALEQEQLEELNEKLLKNYLSNFKYEYPNIYIQGDFRIKQCRALTPDDLFPNGIIIQVEAVSKSSIRKQQVAYPVSVEIVLPHAPVQAVSQMKENDLLELHKKPYFLSILNVQRVEREDDDTVICFTVVPLVYESAWNPAGGSPFSIEPNQQLNIEATFPLFK